MGEVLAEIFKHNQWATLELLSFCKAQDEKVLDSRGKGMYGSAYDTLVHLVAAERRYASGYRPLKSADVNEMMGKEASLDMLLASARETGDIFIGIAAGAVDDWTIEREYRGQTHILKGSTILMQAIDHPTEHRTQVRDILTQQGVEPPVLDGWVYSGEA
jgi:uncharacterized damage-inducible protein DinB